MITASVVRACYGAALLCMPGRMIATATGRAASGRACAVARVLGVRHLSQAVICGLCPTPQLIAAGTAVDALHSASMLALAGVEPGLRRALLADAGVAAGLASAGAAAVSASR